MQEVVNALPGGYPESIQPPTSNQQSLSQAVYGRRSEYTRPRDIKIKVCAFPSWLSGYGFAGLSALKPFLMS
jgi:hypothetical protein